jgi:hypothetical protein
VKRAAAVLISMVVLGGSTGAAVASEDAPPPPNDALADATVIDELPFSDTVDTTGATDVAGEDGSPEFPGFCYPAQKSVWYSITPTTDLDLLVNTQGSDFDTTLEVFRGSDREVVACDDDGGFRTSALRVSLDADEEYLIRAAGYFGDSGTLQLNAEEFVPLSVDVTLADTGRLTVGGRAVVEATVTCSRPVDVELYLDGRQAIGPTVTAGSSGRFFRCSGSDLLTVRVNPDSGAYLPGFLDVEFELYACDYDPYYDCTSADGTKNVLLLPGT